MMFILDNVNPQFRILTDQLFFTDRTDLDLSNFYLLLESDSNHIAYFWDRFIRSTEIFWVEDFWINRFNFIISLHPQMSMSLFEKYLLNRWILFRTSNINNNQSMQFFAWVKAKYYKQESLIDIRNCLLDMPNNTETSKVVKLIHNFIPYVFANLDEYTYLITKKFGQSYRHFDVLKEFERQGIILDKSLVFHVAKELLYKRNFNTKNRNTLYKMMEDNEILLLLKSEYISKNNKNRLIDLISKSEYREIENHHLRNIKNLLELDPLIADHLITTYTDKLYKRGYGNRKANIIRLIRIYKKFPQFSPKKLLVFLSTKGRVNDIKYIMAAFPDLKKLSAFV